MSFDKIARALERRPPPDRMREQLFWLVDLIYACKASTEPLLVQHATLVEEALGSVGTYLETGDTDYLKHATTRLEEFGRVVRQAMVAHGIALNSP
jgi:hypothetical protein